MEMGADRLVKALYEGAPRVLVHCWHGPISAFWQPLCQRAGPTLARLSDEEFAKVVDAIAPERMVLPLSQPGSDSCPILRTHPA